MTRNFGISVDGQATKNGYFNVLIECRDSLRLSQKMNYHSISFFLLQPFWQEKNRAQVEYLIARHLDEKSRYCKQRIGDLDCM
jgi:hypothetical protein